MSKSTNQAKKPPKKWYLRDKSIYNSAVSRAYRKYLRNILWNSALRIIASLLSASILLYSLVVFLLFLSGFKQINTYYTYNWVFVSVILATFIVPLYFCAKYVWSNYNQLSYEIKINQTISWLKWRIKRLSEPKEKKNYRAFQFEITALRTNLINFLEKYLSLKINPDKEKEPIKSKLKLNNLQLNNM